MKKQIEIGIYKLTYIPTGQFYIGATSNLQSRWSSHKSFFKGNRNHQALQQLYNLTHDIDDWSIKMIERCKKFNLQYTEQVYLDKYKNNKKCLNIHSKANKGKRNIKTADEGRHHLAISLLGKNTNNGILRPNNLTFISPDGTEYPHVMSVKRFAEEHNLGQVLMNYLANGTIDSHCGWTRKGSTLPHAVHVQEYWSRERMLQNYPEYEIIGPDGTLYKTFVLHHFEEEHDCTILTEEFTGRSGVKSNQRGLDKYGRGYRLAHIPYLEILYEGKTYTNVISVGKWGKGMGLNEKRTQYLLDRPPLHKIRPTKRTKQFEVKKITPNHNS